MVISIFLKVAIADLTHFSQKNTVSRGFYQIFFRNDGNILKLINHMERYLNRLIEQTFS